MEADKCPHKWVSMQALCRVLRRATFAVAENSQLWLKRLKLVRQDAKWGNELIAALNKYKEAQQ